MTTGKALEWEYEFDKVKVLRERFLCNAWHFWVIEVMSKKEMPSEWIVEPRLAGFDDAWVRRCL